MGVRERFTFYLTNGVSFKIFLGGEERVKK
jgi:hypothetical protein